MRIFFILLLSLFFPLLTSAQAELSAEVASITTPSASLHRFRLEVAKTPEQLEQGLMFRTELDPDSGMIFIFPEPQAIQMWMKNTLIPLDMLFINAEGVISHIHPNAKPQDLTPISSGGEVVAAVELAGGRAAALGIIEGSRIASPSLTPLFR